MTTEFKQKCVGSELKLDSQDIKILSNAFEILCDIDTKIGNTAEMTQATPYDLSIIIDDEERGYDELEDTIDLMRTIIKGRSITTCLD